MTQDITPPEPAAPALRGAAPTGGPVHGDPPLSGSTPPPGAVRSGADGPDAAQTAASVGAVGAVSAGTDPMPVMHGPLWWQPGQGGAMSGPGWDERSRLYAGSAPPPGPSGHPGYPAGGPGSMPGGDRSAAVRPGVPHRRRRGTLIAAATVAVAVAAGFAGGTLGARLTSGTGAAATAAPTQLTTAAVSASRAAAPAGSVQQVAATLLPSVVSVLSSSSSSAGEGSGIILSTDGLILTNNHVISGASNLQVQFNDASTAQATVIGADATDDLAVIKATGASGLTPATLGTSADQQIGQGVVAVGSPLGLSATVTSGIVSALDRPVRTSSDQQQPQQQSPGRGQGRTPSQGSSQDTVMDAIQTDAAINPGNSGGPLVDLTGKVIGINAAIASLSSTASSQGGSIGVGFAIPIDQAKRIAKEIIDTGHATRAVLGASVSDATTGANSLLTVGATIGQVTAGGPADTAGLKTGDIITKIGDQHIDSADALVAAVRAAAPNTAVTITYTRGTDSPTITVTLGTATAN